MKSDLCECDYDSGCGYWTLPMDATPLVEIDKDYKCKCGKQIKKGSYCYKVGYICESLVEVEKEEINEMIEEDKEDFPDDDEIGIVDENGDVVDLNKKYFRSSYCDDIDLLPEDDKHVYEDYYGGFHYLHEPDDSNTIFYVCEKCGDFRMALEEAGLCPRSYDIRKLTKQYKEYLNEINNI